MRFETKLFAPAIVAALVASVAGCTADGGESSTFADPVSSESATEPAPSAPAAPVASAPSAPPKREETKTGGSPAPPPPPPPQECTDDQVHWGGLCLDECPAGTRKGSRCEVAIDVGAADMLGRNATCGDVSFNDCTGEPVGFFWFDLGPGYEAHAARVQFAPSLFCAGEVDGPLSVLVNGVPVAELSMGPGQCRCDADPRMQDLDLADQTAFYLVGGANVVEVVGPNLCLGLQAQAAWGNAVARVTVQY